MRVLAPWRDHHSSLNPLTPELPASPTAPRVMPHAPTAASGRCNRRILIQINARSPELARLPLSPTVARFI